MGAVDKVIFFAESIPKWEQTGQSYSCSSLRTSSSVETVHFACSDLIPGAPWRGTGIVHRYTYSYEKCEKKRRRGRGGRRSERKKAFSCGVEQSRREGGSREGGEGSEIPSGRLQLCSPPDEAEKGSEGRTGDGDWER